MRAFTASLHREETFCSLEILLVSASMTRFFVSSVRSLGFRSSQMFPRVWREASLISPEMSTFWAPWHNFGIRSSHSLRGISMADIVAISEATELRTELEEEARVVRIASFMKDLNWGSNLSQMSSYRSSLPLFSIRFLQITLAICRHASGLSSEASSLTRVARNFLVSKSLNWRI